MSFIHTAAECLRQGGVILVPTDTHYALAVSPFSPDAGERVRQMKACSAEQGTLCVTSAAELSRWVTLNLWQQQQVEQLTLSHWPGALKLLLPRSATLPAHPLLSGPGVAVLCNHNTLLNATIAALGHPLLVVPARPFAADALVSMTAARDSFGTRVDLVLPSNNRNQCSYATTFVSLMHNRLEVLRRGEVEIAAPLCVA